MDSPSPGLSVPPLEGGPKASSVIVHRVPPASRERFLQWQRDITQAAEGFPGYRGTDFYPSAGEQQPEWVVVIHFNNAEALQRWLDSPVRAERVAKLPREIAAFRLKTLSSGFGPWFAGLVGQDGLPSHWKMALAVLLGLYPIVMLLTIFVTPYTKGLGLAVSMLIGNTLSVCILEWGGMPAINLLLGPWFRATSAQGRALLVLGTLLLLVVLAVLTVLFYQVTG